MEMQNITHPATEAQTSAKTEHPRYETPRIKEMSERDILNSFQITQSMSTWWTTM